MREERSQQREWLERNRESLKWRLTGPNFRNQFDSSVSEEKLEEYILDRQLLMENSALHCYLDESSIMKVTDLMFFDYETSHPNIIGLERDELRRYLEASGVWDKMLDDVDALQEDAKVVLAERRGGSSYSL